MKKALATAILAISPITFAGTLTIPQEFEFIAINGKTVSSSMFSHNDEEKLVDGENKVALQYKDLIREEIGDGHVKVSSAPFVITFDADADLDYKLKSAAKLTDQAEAEAYAVKPMVVVKDENGKQVSLEVVHTASHDRGIFNQLMGVYPTAQQESVAATGGAQVAQAVSPMAAATAPAGTVAVAAAAAPTVVVAPAPTVANQPHSMLQYWWSEADAATRAGFTSWAVQHLVSTDAPKASNGDNQAENMLRYWFLKADESTRKTFMSWAIQNL
ncbi:DUF2057 domain-containing protein [Ferrimonas lipolytica]|uniref:DUF2057 domain-containing protein n=1 Tax=Ferrimonas lipolytica TaxID=2724191 RepID=A0A6H1UF27_9GAMM|nr:DUF2057 domain-containing protein [Ferrimonas lipolytica]QIZ77200.1 DUF2057 domain-containing protein [Ferrimonas lipolytica]